MKPKRLSSSAVVRKRVVLHHATGPFAGLHQIVGVLEGTPAQLAQACEPVLYYGNPQAIQTANHEKTTPRYIQYREWAQAPTGRLNDFNPAQV